MASATSDAPTHGPAPQRRPRSRKSIAHLPSPNSIEGEPGQENRDPAGTANTGIRSASLKADAVTKKSRSKSLGPGMLDALSETSGNKRKSSANQVPKSILKPSIPLSPMREIPTRRTATAKGAVDYSATSVTQKIHDSNTTQSKQTTGTGGPSGIFGHPQTESQNQTADPESNALSQLPDLNIYGLSVDEDDAEVQERKKQKEALQKQREERRKSLGNRRVSFAPEATLHTFDIELMDPKSSSTPLEPTRRTTFGQSQGSAADGRTSTPQEQTEEEFVPRSTEHRRDARQARNRRRSSGIPPMNFNDPAAVSPSSYGSGSPGTDDAGSKDPSEDEDGSESVASNSEDVAPGSTIIGKEFTSHGTSQNNGKGNEEDLDNSLSDAASRAGTRQLEIDENGDVSMEVAGDEVTAAFQPWVKQSTGVGSPHPRMSKTLANPEKAKLISPIAGRRSLNFFQGSPAKPYTDDGDLSMDMTKPIGGIVPATQQDTGPHSGLRGTRQREADRRRSSAISMASGEGTMDFTTAIGGIQFNQSNTANSQVDENEDLSMEFTSVFGGLEGKGLQRTASASCLQRKADDLVVQQASEEADGDGEMEMTAAVGCITQTQAQQEKSHRSNEGGNEGEIMDFTNAISEIERTLAHSKGEAEASASSSMRGPTKSRPSLSTSAAGSPNIITGRSRGRPRKSDALTLAPTPDRRHPQTPSKQITPQAPRPGTPSKTPPSSKVSMRKSSPKKLFHHEIQASSSPATNPNLFQQNKDGSHTPSVLLAPTNKPLRRVSGIGIDREGLGSPRMAEILDRRTSIGDKADVFAPQKAARTVRFDDPQALEADIVKEREEDQRKESGNFIMEQEADDEDHENTASLREMMQSMTPKRTKTKGRKSLATGSAKGLLGKRPAELDDSENENSPKTFGNASSPVKRVRLQGAPFASRTTKVDGKQVLSEISGNNRPFTPTSGSGLDQRLVTTPRSQSRFKDAESLPIAQKPMPTMGQTAPAEAERPMADECDDKIGLQDFLNLTNIRFMDLTTTKRRPTGAPTSDQENRNSQDDASKDPSDLLQDSIAAGTCTIPMLELFQHSCRELKKYIAEGRSVVREIEAETLENNPALFREYLSSTPSERSVMDNQFKNMKTNSRLLSKATWYEWRMKLLDGLKESLSETAGGMDGDDEILRKQEALLEPMLENLVQGREKSRNECRALKERAAELSSCDPEDIKTARSRLVRVSKDVEQKKAAIEKQKFSLNEMNGAIEVAKGVKIQCQAATRDAQRIREEYRGWSAAEIGRLRARVESIEIQTGWSITSAIGTTLTITYLHELRLFLDIAAFLLSNSGKRATDAPHNAPISLVYIGDEAPPHHRRRKSVALTTTKRFFLQILRASLQALPRGQTLVSDVLKLVCKGWEVCKLITKEIEMLQLLVGVTRETIRGDETMTVEATLLLEGLGTKVLTSFEVHVDVGLSVDMDPVRMRVVPTAKVVYGEEYDGAKMGNFLSKRVPSTLDQDRIGTWAEAVRELRAGLLRRGRK